MRGLLLSGILSSRFNQGQMLLRNAQVQLGIGEVTNAEKCLDKAEDYLIRLSSGTGMTVYIRQSLKEIARFSNFREACCRKEMIRCCS